jgi:AraC family transcriptional regulator
MAIPQVDWTFTTMSNSPPDPDPAPPAAGEAAGYYRQVGAQVTPCGRLVANSVRFESNHLHATEPVVWRFRQPEAALFWWDCGFRRYDLEVDGGTTSADQAARRPFGLIPPNAEVRGEHHIEPNCTYHVLFIDPMLMEDQGRKLIDEPMIGFSDDALERSILELSHWRHDATYPLMAEGWALQAVARMRARLTETAGRTTVAGGFSGATFRRIEDYIAANLHQPIGMAELAAVAGVSVRHFSRAFLAHTGKTPARLVHDRRMELARILLSRPALSLPDIAYACGFAQAHHFATSFKRATGLTPTAYRQRLAA